jgi:iron complex outermembrane recepter protein
LKYTYRYALNVALGYNHTKDYSQTITTQTGQQTQATAANIGSLDNAYINISAPLPITKWWEGYANVTGFYNHYKGVLPNGILNQKTLGLNYYIQNNFKLGKGWSTQASSWFNAGTREAIFKTRALGSFDIAVKKNILNDKGSIRLTLTDVFNTQQWRQEVQFANMDFTYRRKWESRGVRLQFSWSFGKTKFQARERDTNQDANRIKVKG